MFFGFMPLRPEPKNPRIPGAATRPDTTPEDFIRNSRLLNFKSDSKLTTSREVYQYTAMNNYIII